MKRWGGEGRKRRGEKCPQSRKRSHGNAKCPDVAVPNTGAARTGLKRGEHDKLPSLMPISAILLYEQRSEGTWRGFLGLSLPPPLSIPTFHRPRFTKRLGVFIALIYIRNVYTENARRHIYIYIYVYAVLRVRPLRHGIHSSLPSACTHYSRRTCTKYSCTRAHSAREIAYACDLRVYVQIYTRVIIYICATHENSFPSPPSLLQGIGGSIYKAVTNEPWKSRAVLRIECTLSLSLSSSFAKRGNY